MPDLAQILAKKISARGKQPKAYAGLRATVTVVAVLSCLVVVVLWLRSYTYRDRMSVPLGESLFCRFDSDCGKFEYESYGPDMGEMSFSTTSRTHRELSAAWKRFTDAPEPGPGPQWRWERSDTGRFFIHVPHWFLAGLALAVASAPWLPWRFRIRTLLGGMAALSVALGLLVWLNAPPDKSEAISGVGISDLLRDMQIQGDDAQAEIAASEHDIVSQTQKLDFTKLTSLLDNAIGERLPKPPMDGPELAMYQYNGPIERVLDIIGPLAKENAFSELTGEAADAVAQEMDQVMANGVMKRVDQKLFRRPDGACLIVNRLAIGKTGMMMLTITYMEP